MVVRLLYVTVHFDSAVGASGEVGSKSRARFRSGASDTIAVVTEPVGVTPPVPNGEYSVPMMVKVDGTEIVVRTVAVGAIEYEMCVKREVEGTAISNCVSLLVSVYVLITTSPGFGLVVQ